MKTQLRIAALSVLVVLSLTLAAVPASAADTVLFGNYPIDGTSGKYVLDGRTGVTDSATLWCPSTCSSITVTELKFGLWLNPEDTLTSLSWSLDELPFGVDNPEKNTNYGMGAGCAECGTLTVVKLFVNIYGYQVVEATVSGLNGGKGVSVPNPDFVWLRLIDATTFGATQITYDSVYWDATPCTKSYGCPLAYSDISQIPNPPTLPPNTFEIIGHYN